MKYVKQAVIWGVKYGIPIGLAIGFTFVMIFSGIYGSCTLSFEYILKDYIISAVVGFWFSAMSVIYTVNSWSKLKQTVAHFAALIAVFLPCSLYAGWIPQKPMAIAGFIIIYVLIYLCYWLSFYFYWKHKIREVNAAIKMRNS